MIDTDLPAPMWVILGEHGKAVRLSFEDGNRLSMVFRLFSVAGTGGGWELFDGSDLHRLDDWQAAFWEIEGYLKWDGIFDWHTNPECMMHGLDIGHVRELTAVFSAILHVGARHFDYLDGEIPPMPEGAIVLVETAIG